jgi:hypothetical protein
MSKGNILAVLVIGVSFFNGLRDACPQQVSKLNWEAVDSVMRMAQ